MASSAPVLQAGPQWSPLLVFAALYGVWARLGDSHLTNRLRPDCWCVPQRLDPTWQCGLSGLACSVSLAALWRGPHIEGQKPPANSHGMQPHERSVPGPFRLLTFRSCGTIQVCCLKQIRFGVFVMQQQRANLITSRGKVVFSLHSCPSPVPPPGSTQCELIYATYSHPLWCPLALGLGLSAGMGLREQGYGLGPQGVPIHGETEESTHL